jgi:hypothetical protein
VNESGIGDQHRTNRIDFAIGSQRKNIQTTLRHVGQYSSIKIKKILPIGREKMRMNNVRSKKSGKCFLNFRNFDELFCFKTFVMKNGAFLGAKAVWIEIYL